MWQSLSDYEKEDSNNDGLDIAQMDPRDNGMLQNMPQLDYKLDEYILRYVIPYYFHMARVVGIHVFH